MHHKRVLQPLAAFVLTALLLPISAFAYPLQEESDDVAEPNEAVETVLQMPDGSTYIGGSFTQVDGTSRTFLAHILANGTLDADFTTSITGTYVGALEISEDGNTLYIGGEFTNVGGEARANIAAVDAETGAVDMDWNPDTDGPVYALELNTDDNLLYVGGDFADVGGETRNDLAAVSYLGAIDATWNPGGTASGINDIIYESSTSTVYIGGDFAQVGGQSRANLAAVDAESGLATAFQSDTNDYVNDLALDVAHNRLYVAGNFTQIGGGAGLYLAKVNATTGGGNLWNPAADAEVTVLALDSENDALYVAGSFTEIGGESREKFAELDAVGGLASSWYPTVSSFIYEMGYNATAETLAIGGVFATVNGEDQEHFARFTVASEPVRRGSTYVPVIPPGVQVVSPNGGEHVKPGTVVDVEWKIQGRVDLINVKYSMDNGATWHAILSAHPVGANRIAWHAPSVRADQALVRVEATDLAIVYASDDSDSTFRVGATEEPARVVPPPSVPSSVLVRTPETPTVYALDGDIRRPFLNEATFFTHGFSFKDVVIKSTAEVAAIPLGAPMLPKAGTVFVKLESIPTVYLTEAVEGNAAALRLRPIASEADAVVLAGPAWADYVIDLPVTVFSRMVLGEPATSVSLDRSLLRRRVELK